MELASPGLTEDGIDIDAFGITRASRAIRSGDTSAKVNLPTKMDCWNLVYIILSFRSKITSDDIMDYLIRSGGALCGYLDASVSVLTGSNKSDSQYAPGVPSRNTWNIDQQEPQHSLTEVS